MASQPPQVLSRRTNGVLPVTASQTQQKENKENKGRDGGSRRGGRGRGQKDADKQSDAPKKAPKPKKEPEGEKLTIRRIPPGMTEAEFGTILGDEWAVGKGKVDWLSFAAGKLSLDPAKQSRPGRAYIHLMQKDLVMPFSDHVRNCTWEDAANSFNSSSLLSQPYVEFSIYKKVPNGKKRQDARQGTIDQDAEFMAFLEELANPAIPKDTLENDEDEAKADAKPTTTPLVEYIKEKKAQKAKDAASGKTSKHTRNNSGPSKGKGSKEEENTSSKKKGRDPKSDKTDKGPKETVKILTKKDVAEQPNDTGATTSNSAATSSDAPKSRRAGIAAAARILQRDLGLSPGSAHRKARQDAAKADADKGTTQPEPTSGLANSETISRDTSPAPSNAERSAGGSKGAETASASKSSTRRGRGGKNTEKGKAAETAQAAAAAPTPSKPILLKKRPEGESSQPAEGSLDLPSTVSKVESTGSTSGSKGSTAKLQNQNKKAAASSADTKRGFVKHANASQGITEDVLKSVLAAFGDITFIEVDKRKGFAYVDFAEPKSLLEAISASPIAAAQGAVHVLERKDKKTPQQQQQAPSASTAGANGATNGAEKTGSGSGGGGRGRRGRGGGGGKAPAPAGGASAARPSGAASSPSGG